MCLKCLSSERDLSPPQMRIRYLQASCCWLATTDGPLGLVSTIQELARVGYVSPTVTGNMFLDLSMSSVTEHNFDQKYTTSWVMDDLHSQILQAIQVSLENKNTYVTASPQSEYGTTPARL